MTEFHDFLAKYSLTSPAGPDKVIDQNLLRALGLEQELWQRTRCPKIVPAGA